MRTIVVLLLLTGAILMGQAQNPADAERAQKAEEDQDRRDAHRLKISIAELHYRRQAAEESLRKLAEQLGLTVEDAREVENVRLQRDAESLGLPREVVRELKEKELAEARRQREHPDPNYEKKKLEREKEFNKTQEQAKKKDQQARRKDERARRQTEEEDACYALYKTPTSQLSMADQNHLKDCSRYGLSSDLAKAIRRHGE